MVSGETGGEHQQTSPAQTQRWVTSAKSNPAAAVAAICVSDDDLLILIYHVITATHRILYLNKYNIFYKKMFILFYIFCCSYQNKYYANYFYYH